MNFHCGFNPQRFMRNLQSATIAEGFRRLLYISPGARWESTFTGKKADGHPRGFRIYKSDLKVSGMLAIHNGGKNVETSPNVLAY